MQAPAFGVWQIHPDSISERNASLVTKVSCCCAGDPPPVVKHAVKSAKVHMGRCRLVYLSTMHEGEDRCKAGSGGQP